MENTGQMTPQDLRMQGLLDRYLATRGSGPAADEPHLDADSLAAFTEGNLSEREAKPIVRHLVDCSFCRHITAELVRLDLEFAPAEEPALRQVESADSSKVSEVLSGLFSKIFGTGDAAVFAHNESDEEKNDEEPEDGEKLN